MCPKKVVCLKSPHCSTQQVKYVDDTGLAYVMQRYREVHDLIHVINGMGVGYAFTNYIQLLVH